MFPRFISIPILASSVLICLSCSAVDLKKDSAYSEVISKDTTWEGEVFVDGVVLVRKGATLRIFPGSVVRFSRGKLMTLDEHEGFAGSGIKIEGRIVAEGTAEDPVTFTSAEPEGPGSWDRLYFVFSRGSVLKHCVVEYGGYAVHSHFSRITIESSLFRRNVEGVRLGGSKVAIRDSVFTGNRVRGINFKDSRNVITGCAVYNNGVGIFLHSKDSESVIRENALYHNKRYDLRLGDLHVDDIDVSRNWWGSAEKDYVEGRVYDGKDQEGLGVASVSPYLEKPSVKVSGVKGFLVSERGRRGGKVYVLKSLKEGFADNRAVYAGETDKSGGFTLYLPPGRYFVYGRSETAGGDLFGFTGNNPMIVAPFEERLLVIPLVNTEGTEPEIGCSEGGYAAMRVVAKKDGQPVAGAFIYLYNSGALDIHGPGVASAVTSGDGSAEVRVPPGKYIVAARKRAGGSSLGTVNFGGLFGVSPHLPLQVKEGCVTEVTLPVFVKEGIVGDEGEGSSPTARDAFASLDGEPAGGYMVYFYRGREPVGRPAFVSEPVGRDGYFMVETIDSVGEGAYFAFLRKASGDMAGSSEEIKAGPLEVRVESGVLAPARLEF